LQELCLDRPDWENTRNWPLSFHDDDRHHRRRRAVAIGGGGAGGSGCGDIVREHVTRLVSVHLRSQTAEIRTAGGPITRGWLTRTLAGTLNSRFTYI
jgi:hypothetical protein